MKYYKTILSIFISLFFHISTFSQDIQEKVPPPFLNYGKEWVDSVFNTLSPDERIAQLIFVAAYSNKDIVHEVEITDVVRKYKIGGLIFFQGDPLKQAILTNFYQSQSKVPLLIAMDGEWGLGMRLNNIMKFPYQMSLGAITNDSLIYTMGCAVANQCKRLGVHINLVPVMDINNNLKNPVINYRSFGEDKRNITSKVAMYMKGLQDNGILARAILAGNDILEFTKNVPQAIMEIKKNIKEGLISQEEIDNRCRKVLSMKYRAGLNDFKKINTENLIADLNPVSSKLLNRKLIKASLTVLRNNEDLVPLKNLDQVNIATLMLGASVLTPFQSMLEKYTRMEHFNWTEDMDTSATNELFVNLQSFDLLVVGISDLNQIPYKDFGITEKMKQFLKQVIQSNQTLVVVFGNAYSLDKFKGIETAKGLILTYQDGSLFQELAAQVIFGGIGATGKLPVNVNEYFKLNDGIDTPGGIRFSYTLPEAVGMNSEVLDKKIDSIALMGIREKAFPGCQVLAAHEGAIIFHKWYGFQTYNNLIPVKKTDLYDFASVTKITGPLPALMKLYDNEKIDLNEKFSYYWPDFKRSNKSKIIVRDVLAHQASLIPYISYWKNTIRKNGKFKWHTLKRDSSQLFPVKVNNKLYLHKNYINKIYRAIRKSPMRENNDLTYSGLSFILYPKIIENLTGISYETYLKRNFYRPLGAFTLTYNPANQFPLARIIPTEYDDLFRMEQIHGYVHDEAAAMMGGISGNAGLFGTANDLAKLMQMYLNMGVYGGKRFISEETLKEFTRYQFADNKNRRGLGFDKPLLENQKLNPEETYPTISASSSSFGHSGFTGTFTWVDPEKELLYVFFSNRVYPTRENQKIYDLNIRTSILQVLYDAMVEK
ncbi:MAG: serine hydrolase [Bacteroidetes bacterium]|nr:serine hydrolase [Bacteroidota bacterium]